MILVMDKMLHRPVMLEEVIASLNIKTNGRYVDCTLGLGGHTRGILNYGDKTARVLGIDADPESLAIAADNLRDFSDRLILVNDNFVNLERICKQYDFYPVDGVLFDLGVSSMHLDRKERGFSFSSEYLPDMRFNRNQVVSAALLLNTLSEGRLSEILFKYGEEKKSREIAKEIVKRRPISSAKELADIVEDIYGGRWQKTHPATRTFLAIRIAVNNELDNLEQALSQAVNVIDAGGRLVVISYHSLEDRIVKQFMRRESRDCICPPSKIKCECNHRASVRILTKKVLTPTHEEIKINPRSRSAKLRVAEHI